jgi:hypothetical protein
MGYLGNGLTITGTQNSKRIVVDATPNQTISTVTGGYLTGQLDVYRNGVKLVDTQDYTASDGASVTFLNAVSEGDELEFVVFENFDVANALSKSGGSLNGDLVVTGIATFNSDVSIGGTLTYEDVTNIDSVGLITARSGVEIGTPGIAATLTAAGGAVFTGIVTATFSGDGTGLTGVASTDNINTSTLAQFTGGVGIADSIFHLSDDNTAIRFPAVDTFSVETAGSQALRVDSNQIVSVNNPNAIYSSDDNFVVHDSDAGARIGFQRQDTGQVTAGEELGALSFYSNDGDLNPSARMLVEADDAHAAGDKPGRIIFQTVPDASTTLTERLRIHADGEVQILGENAAAGQTPLSVEGNYSASGNVDVQTWARSGGAVKAAMRYVDADTLLKLGTTTNHGFAFITNTNERLRITNGGTIFTTNATAAGSLGVGTDSPGKVSGMSRYLALSAAAADNAVGFELQGNRSGNDEPVARFSFINDDTETARITVDSGTGGGASGNMIFATGGSTERLRIDPSGHLIHTGLRSGNGENKLAVLSTPSHDTSEEDVALYIVENESSSNQLTFGGGSSSYNAVTTLRFITASAVDTTTGSERLRIGGSGQIGLGGANYGTSGQVLTSNGSGSAVTWEDAATGGITTHVGTASGIVTSVFLNDATDHKVTVTGFVTFTATQAGTEGQSHTIRIVNSGIATVGFSTYFLFPSGSAPVLPIADGAVSLISFTVHDSVGAGCTQLLAGASLNFS